MSLAGTTRTLSAGDLAREPRSLAVVAWFDGWSRGGNPAARPMEYDRRLDPEEAASWREGFQEGRRERACHARHGFVPCPGDHPPGVLP